MIVGWRFRTLLLLLYLLFIAGCGSSSSDVVTAPIVPGPTSPTATVRLQSVLAQRSVPSQIVTFRASGFDREQALAFGPISQTKAAQVEWSEVPISVTDFVIEYLDANGEIVAISQTAVQLVANQAFVISNPNLLSASSSLERLTLDLASVTLAKGTSASFQLTGRFNDGTFLDLTSAASWSSSDSNIATVSGGTVQGRSPGAATIRASFAGQFIEAQVTITDATLISLSLSPNTPAIAVGTEQDFTVAGLFSDGTFDDLTSDVTWESSDTTIATITNGTAQGLAPGQTTISVSFDGKSASTVLNVTSATLESLEITGGASSITKGTSTNFRAIGHYTDNTSQDLTTAADWTSESSSVDIDKGVAYGSDLGTNITLTASFLGTSGSASISVTEAQIVALKVETVGTNAPTLLNVGDALNLKATATFTDDSEQDVTLIADWTSSATSVATVAQGNPNGGTVTGATPGQSEISASFDGQSGSLRVSVQVAPRPDLVLSESGTYTFDTTTGELLDPSEQIVENTGWRSSEKSLILNTLTISNGATLKFYGSSPLKVLASEEITINGTIDGKGDDVNGRSGKEIVLFCGGDLTGAGSIDVSGRHGAVSENGGAGGKISLTTASQLSISTLEASGGHGSFFGSGGHSGTVALNSEGSVTDTTVNTNGGNGGSAGVPGVGGPGGNGGNVTLTSQSSISNTIVNSNGSTGGDVTLTSVGSVSDTTVSSTGGNGGNVSLASQGSVTGTTISCSGSTGGDVTLTSVGSVSDTTVTSTGSNGGNVSLTSQASVTDTTINCSGNDFSGPGGSGGAAGSVTLTARGPVTNTTVICNGGHGSTNEIVNGGSGANGGNVTFTFEGSAPGTTVSCNGGDGGDSLSSRGGNGGNIRVSPFTTTGMNVNPGSGGVSGIPFSGHNGSPGSPGTITSI